MVMDVLSRLLNVAFDLKLFDCHPRCSKVSLSHLYFADDLIIFTAGNRKPVLAVQKIFHFFCWLSGMQFNSSKSEIICGGLDPSTISDLLSTTSFKHGT